MNATAQRRVSMPFQDPRSKFSRSGQQQWTVTLKDGCKVENHRFDDEADAQALYRRAVAAGFEEGR